MQSVINKDQMTTDVFGIGTMEDRRRWGYENMTEEQIRNLGDSMQLGDIFCNYSRFVRLTLLLEE